MIKKTTSGILLILTAWLVALLLVVAAGIDQLSEKSYRGMELRKKASMPFEEWTLTAHIVLVTMGDQFTEVLNPPSEGWQTRHFLKKGKKNRWTIEIWEGKGKILKCGWQGDKAIGLFEVPTARGPAWGCGKKSLDENFFRVSHEDPRWADVVDPAAVQAE